MPALESLDRKQKAAYWEAYTAANQLDNYGQRNVKSPVELKVRWVEGQREMLDAQGNSIAVDATAVVDRVIPLGSILWLGALADVPNPITQLHEVISRENTPDIKGRNMRRTVGLKRFRDALPTIA